MARLATVAEQQARQGATQRAGGLTFADVPEHLRPSELRQWLAQVPAAPQADDEKAIAYGGEAAPNPYDEHSVEPDLSTVPINAHWRGMVAEDRQQEAYRAWLAEHGVDWRSPEWSRWDFRCWEKAQCAS